MARTRRSIGRVTDDDRHAAWDELHAATPPGWFVGRAGHATAVSGLDASGQDFRHA
jgi:hypothetical protein